jgi:hypothetical protein
MIDPNNFLRPRTILPTSVRRAHLIDVGGYLLQVSEVSSAGGGTYRIKASTTHVDLALLIFAADPVDVMEFDGAAFEIEETAEKLAAADGSRGWLELQEEDRHRWRKLAGAVVSSGREPFPPSALRRPVLEAKKS